MSRRITFADALMRRAFSTSAALLRPTIIMAAAVAVLSLMAATPIHAQWVKRNTSWNTPGTNNTTIVDNHQYGTCTFSNPAAKLTSTSDPSQAPQPYGFSTDGISGTIVQNYYWTGTPEQETSFSDNATRHMVGSGYYALSKIGSWRKDTDSFPAGWDVSSDLTEILYEGGVWGYGPNVNRSLDLSAGSRSQSSSPNGYGEVSVIWSAPF